ncbi:MAG TPA: nicotinic acid mononucleotide adenylyltransferase, partial [Caulobacteraceae bacterium]
PADGFSDRLLQVAPLARGPSMLVSDFEGRIGARYTIQTIRALKTRFPGVHFVWIMGADGLGAFHRWRDWTRLMRELPMAVVARPHVGLKSRFSPAARRFAGVRRPMSAARGLALAQPPAWVYLDAPLNPASSTALRVGRGRGVI